MRHWIEDVYELIMDSVNQSNARCIMLLWNIVVSARDEDEEYEHRDGNLDENGDGDG